MKRYKHNLSHYRMVTGAMGNLMPIACVPTLPGDTIQMSTSALVRVSPLNTPVMHPTAVRIHHWFVPYRVIWPDDGAGGGWENFITGGDGVTPPAPIPTITKTDNTHDMLAYLGVPPIAGTNVSKLPLRCVNKIINERYRDQDLGSERNIDATGTYRISWEKDRFTTARPWSQKGPTVSLPVGDTAPIVSTGDGEPQFLSGGSVGGMAAEGTTLDMHFETATATGGPMTWQDPKLLADLAQASSPEINAWRAAFAVQRYQEARARYGSRFTEYLRYLGVTPSDSRLQEPEFLGGGTTRLSFSEVLQTANDPTDPGGQREDLGVGDMYGHGIAGARTNTFRRFFEEHGCIITLLSVRPKSIYMNGVPREFLKETKEDYFQKELTNLGQQEVWKAEVYSEPTGEVFGYEDRYNEYRRIESQVGQDFRTTLNAYHMARELDGTVTLNSSFTNCNPSDRIFQVGQDLADPLWIMANHKIVARRMVPKRANPRII